MIDDAPVRPEPDEQVAPPPATRLRRIRQQVMERQLTALNGRDRAVVVILVGLSGVAVALTSLMVFERGPVDIDSPPGWHATSAVVIVVGLITAMGVLAAVVRAEEGTGVSRRILSITVAVLPYAALGILVCTVVITSPVVLAAELNSRPAVVALVMWVSLAVVCLWVLRRSPNHDTSLLDRRRAAKVVLPAVALVLLVLIVGWSSGSASAIGFMLTPSIVMVAFASLVVLPAMSAGGAAGGLQKFRDRGKRVAEFVRPRPWLLLVAGGAKILAIVGLWWASSDPLLGTTPLAWVSASVLTLLVVTVFAVNRRLRISTADHLVVSRAAGLLVGGTVGGVVVLALTVGLTPAFRHQPLAVPAIAVMTGVALVAARSRRRTLQVGALGVTVLLAVCAAVWVGLPSAGHVTQEPTPLIDFTLVSVVFVVGLIVLVIASAVVIVVKRRISWLTYLVSLLTWIALLLVIEIRVAPAMTMLNVDLALTVVLTVAAALYALGWQRDVDAFEISVTLVVTFFAIELPLLGGLLPSSETAKLWFAVLALITAGLATIWSVTAALGKPAEQRGAFTKLAASTLLLYLLLALAWTQKNGASGIVEGINGLFLGYLTVPLVLLLVAAVDEDLDAESTPVQGESEKPTGAGVSLSSGGN